MKHCSWCDNQFSPTVSYQIYCSTSCRDQATKQKIADRYIHTRRQKRVGKNRKCRSCDQDLSIYNDESLCNNCMVDPKEVNKALKDMKGIANGKK